MITSTVPSAKKKQKPRRTWAGATALIVSGTAGVVVSGVPITVQAYPHTIPPRAWTAVARIALLQTLDSLDSDSHTVSIPLQITVQRTEAGDYVARIPAAKISASGDSENEAIEMLKDMVVGRIEHLSAIPKSEMGKVPREQLRALTKHIQSK